MCPISYPNLNYMSEMRHPQDMRVYAYTAVSTGEVFEQGQGPWLAAITLGWHGIR